METNWSNNWINNRKLRKTIKKLKMF